MFSKSRELAYIIGVAIGDGGLSNPNGRAVRLRISCDTKYPRLVQKIITHLKIVNPKNKISTIPRKSRCLDISCYSNQWENVLGWKALAGPKHKQNIKIPSWIKENKEYAASCLCGLIETDGSIYKDRNYTMVNFTTIIDSLAQEVFEIIERMGFKPNLQKVANKNRVRISKDSLKFIKHIGIEKQ